LKDLPEALIASIRRLFCMDRMTVVLVLVIVLGVICEETEAVELGTAIQATAATPSRGAKGPVLTEAELKARRDECVRLLDRLTTENLTFERAMEIQNRLKQIASVDTVPQLAAILDSPGKPRLVYIVTSAVVGHIGGGPAREVFTKVLARPLPPGTAAAGSESEEAALRGMAAHYLEQCGDASTIPVLRKQAIESPFEHVRYSCGFVADILQTRVNAKKTTADWNRELVAMASEVTKNGRAVAMRPLDNLMYKVEPDCKSLDADSRTALIDAIGGFLLLDDGRFPRLQSEVKQSNIYASDMWRPTLSMFEQFKDPRTLKYLEPFYPIATAHEFPRPGNRAGRRGSGHDRPRRPQPEKNRQTCTYHLFGNHSRASRE
jgi:hypothetical protein